MTRTKREENSIVIYCAFYTVLFISLLVYIIVGIYPAIKNIEGKKTSVKNTYDTIITLNNEGLNYDDFIKNTKNIKLNSYITELLKNIEEPFYNLHFKNKSDKTFVDFLKETKEEFNNKDIQDTFNKKVEKIIKLLPTYSEVDLEEDSNNLTDFKFINYIESILETFSLDYSDEIGLNDIVLVEEYTDKDSNSKLETSIYYIPVDLDVIGTKYNIINFLYFLENVGSVKFASDGALELLNQNNDNFLLRSGIKTVLENKSYLLKGNSTKEFQEYNIYENQLIDIESISFKDYIDSKEKINQGENNIGMYRRVKNTQGDEEISVKLGLRFYIKGVQNIKIIESIQSYITYFNTTKDILSEQYTNKNIQGDIKIKIKKYQAVLTELSKELKEINGSITKQENLTETLFITSKSTNNLHKIHAQIGYNFYISHFLQEVQKLLNNKELSIKNPELYNYITGIEKNIDSLKQGKTEEKESYTARINNKEFFEQTYQYQKNINTKK